MDRGFPNYSIPNLINVQIVHSSSSFKNNLWFCKPERRLMNYILKIIDWILRNLNSTWFFSVKKHLAQIHIQVTVPTSTSNQNYFNRLFTQERSSVWSNPYVTQQILHRFLTTNQLSNYLLNVKWSICYDPTHTPAIVHQKERHSGNYLPANN